jgi:Zn-dependent protease with chaperone function
MSTRTVACSAGHANAESARFCTCCGEALSTLSVPPQATVRAAGLPPSHCSGCGAHFLSNTSECRVCGHLKPLAFGHKVAPELFQWSLDGQAMARLRSIKPLVSFAQSVSQRAGKPWIEANFNGIRLSYRQMPQIYASAVQAARMLGLTKMPIIYVSGACPWDAFTFGCDQDAFIVVGSALVSCFQRNELMFIFAREMGHILAGHALWKTVIQFLVGAQSTNSGMMRNGIAGLLDPSRLIEGAIELPLIAWARQAEITADRAGLLVSSGLTEARKVLMIWSLKSPILYRQINIEAWLEQQEHDSLDANIRLAETVSSSTNYLTRRLKLMQEYDASMLVKQFRQQVMASVRPSPPLPPKLVAAAVQSAATRHGNLPPPVSTTTHVPSPSTPERAKSRKLTCPACKRPMWISPPATATPIDSSAGDAIIVRCPQADCKKLTKLRAKASLLPTTM